MKSSSTSSQPPPRKRAFAFKASWTQASTRKGLRSGSRSLPPSNCAPTPSTANGTTPSCLVHNATVIFLQSLSSKKTGQIVRFLPFLIRLYQAIDAPGRPVATSLFLSFKNTKTEHKCSVFLAVLLQSNELLIYNRTLCSVLSKKPETTTLFLISLSHSGSAAKGWELSIVRLSYRF